MASALHEQNQQKKPHFEPAAPSLSIHKSVYVIDPITCAPERLYSVNDEHGRPTSTASGGNESSSYHRNDEASHINILVMSHATRNAKEGAGGGMVWVWAQVTPSKGTFAGAAPMDNLALGMPPKKGLARASASQLIGSGVDDPTVDIVRRLSTKFKRPVYISLSNVTSNTLVSAARAGVDAAALGTSSVSLADELMALERCLFVELKRVLQ